MATEQPTLATIERAHRAEPDQHTEFLAHEETIARILELRDRKNALILGHNYMAPQVFQLSGVKERGDSLALARRAAEADNPIILFDGVRFMAETAKILNPEKKVLIADLDAGCSLADAYGAEDVIDYKRRFPGLPVVTYINSYAEVKAESDFCCTSGNAVDVVRHAAAAWGTDGVIFLPDTLMGRNIDHELAANGEGISLVYPGKHDENYGRCYVHEKITGDFIRQMRQQFGLSKDDPTTAVLVHLESQPDAVAEADFCGSTSQMSKYLRDNPQLERVYLGTECEMTANLAAEFPHIDFARTCQIFCEHMARITLEKIRHSLEHEVYEVTVEEETRKRALGAIERMLAI